MHLIMTDLSETLEHHVSLEHAAAPEAGGKPDPKPEPIKKVSIIVSKGSLEGIYPALIMANGARAEGMECNLFFTFFGMDAIHKERIDHVKVATVGNPGMHMPTLLGALPGMSALATHMMTKKMDALDIPPIPEFIEMIGDTGAGIYACKASVDMFGLDKDDFIPQLDDIITVGEFYDRAAGGQIIFT
jgi:peroxiredoxin family protein